MGQCTVWLNLSTFGVPIKTKGKVDGNYSAEEEEVGDLVREEEGDIWQFYLKSLALVIS